MAVIGGGPIGCELAQACSRLGVEVTLVASKILPKEVESARQILQNVFKNEGIAHLKGRAKSVTKVVGDLLEVRTDSDADSNETVVQVEVVLVSSGRDPILPPGCESLFKVDSKSGGLIVSSSLKCILKGDSNAASSNVFAAGDCIHDNYQFTHYAGKQGFLCARNALLLGNDNGMLHLEVPRSTFTSPEIASVGYCSVEDAKKSGFTKAFLLTIHGEHIDRSVTEDAQNETLYEIILSDGHSTSAKIIGANIVAPNAGDVLSSLCVAIKLKTPIIQYANVIQPYPTYSFALMQMIGAEVTKRFVKTSTAKIAKALKF